MKLSEDDKSLVQKHKTKFVSFKYLGNDGFLKQIDFSARTIENGNFFATSDLNLHPIKSKAFIDPFRSELTTSFYCENHDASTNNPRAVAGKIHNSANYPIFNEYFAQISFWVLDEASEDNGFSRIADPIDQHANLRADIISTLESIGIEPTYHHHGKRNNESVIGVKGKNVIDLADNIVISKFVIANVSASYGICISFSFNENINLNLFLKSENTEIGKVYTALTARSKQVSTFSTQTDEYFFELKEIHNYKVDNEVMLHIELLTLENFIPYLCLVDLLSYEAKSKLIESELTLFFKTLKVNV